ncbi:MAG: hypothetical protein KF868_12165 [Acidobacteria bacterium]|nr:hypothetical protein [Acidobacteriota bacterium]
MSDFPGFFRDRRILWAGFVSLLPLLFLVSTPLPSGEEDRYCVKTMSVGGFFHITVNCDSGTYVLLAENPHMLLEQGRHRNSRPLYFATAWLISQPLRALARCCLPESTRRIENSQHLPAYTAYIIINWILLWFAVILFFKLLPYDPKHWPIYIFSGVVLAVNEVTKAFFWTPHLQICNIFVPVCALFVIRREQERGDKVNVFRQFWCGVTVGAATLFYEAFAVIAGAKAIYLLFRREAEGDASSNRFKITQRVQSVLMLTIGLLIPPVGWIAFVNHRVEDSIHLRLSGIASLYGCSAQSGARMVSGESLPAI